MSKGKLYSYIYNYCTTLIVDPILYSINLLYIYPYCFGYMNLINEYYTFKYQLMSVVQVLHVLQVYSQYSPYVYKVTFMCNK